MYNLCLRLPRWAGTTKVKPSGFYWSKRQWVAVASAGPYASLHLTLDRYLCQHPTTQSFTGRVPFLPPKQQRQCTEGICTPCLKKTSHLWSAITLIYVNGFWYFLAEMLRIKQAIKRCFTTPPQITCSSALPGKTGKHKNRIFTQLDCVTRTMHLCADFLKEKTFICDAFDSV